MALNKFKYKICLWKAYFEKGYALTNYLKYFIILFGIYEGMTKQSVIITMITAAGYGIFCFFFGWAWFRFGWINEEIEVGNRFNEFVKEMRNSKIFKDKEAGK